MNFVSIMYLRILCSCVTYACKSTYTCFEWMFIQCFECVPFGNILILEYAILSSLLSIVATVPHVRDIKNLHWNIKKKVIFVYSQITVSDSVQSLSSTHLRKYIKNNFKLILLICFT